jgi:hypothetical protein
MVGMLLGAGGLGGRTVHVGVGYGLAGALDLDGIRPGGVGGGL